jgi:predicted nucleic acid-binding Zn ribbon protein
MQATQIAAKPCHKMCSRCGKPIFEDLPDEQGLCDYCRKIAAIEVSSGKQREQKSSRHGQVTV